MRRFHAFRTITLLLLTPFLLTACAGAFRAQYPIAAMETPEQALTRFTDPALQNAKQLHVGYLGAFEFVDYARYETSSLVLESVYDVATSIKSVLQYDYWMSRMADTWNINHGQPKSWGEAQTVQAWHGKIDYQPYRLTASGRDCIAFNSEWDYQTMDILGRPIRVFFGYVCAQPGKSLDIPKTVALIGGVRFSDRSRESLVPVDGRSRIDPAAIAAATGVAGGLTGNAEFPFNFGTSYVEGDGPERTN